MGSFLTSEQLDAFLAADEHAYPWPVPTQMVSNGEFAPHPQTPKQKKLEQRLAEVADKLARRRGVDRRSFLKTAAGMAATFAVMNEFYGGVYDVLAQEPENDAVAAERAAKYAHQFVFDAQLHFVREDAKPESNPARMVGLRQFAGAYLNPDLRNHAHQVDDIKYQNFVKEVYLDSDTKVGILSGAPADEGFNWFLSNDQMRLARDSVNELAGSKRLLAHAVITPGQPGWLDEIDRAIEELKPDSWKGYTMGDPNGPSKYRWRLDDEALVYPAFEKMVKAGINKVCLHKGLVPPGAEARMPGITAFSDVSDVGKAAKDWPQLDFIIYHAGFNVLMPTEVAVTALEEKGRVEWVSDLAAIPEKFGVSNVFAEVGSSFGISTIMSPRFCAGMMGVLVEGFGHENVFWGTDSVWYGSPQWQIEAFRRMELPQDLQDKFGWKPLGDADGPVKRAILGLNAARHYGMDVEAKQAEFASDKITAFRKEYKAAGAERSNLAYGWIDKRI